MKCFCFISTTGNENIRFIQGKKNDFSITDLADTSVKLGMHAVGVCQGVIEAKN